MDEKPQLVPGISFMEVHEAKLVSSYNDDADIENEDPSEDSILFTLNYKYDGFTFLADTISPVSVEVEEKRDTYCFHRVHRHNDSEKKYLNLLRKMGLSLVDGKVVLPKQKAFYWLAQNKQSLEDIGFNLEQQESREKKFFIGKSSISIEIRESIDWFDIYALVRFGEYRDPF